MEKQFVTHEIALKLKELGFDEKCLAIHDNEGFRLTHEPLKNSMIDHWNVTYPLWQQVIEWFGDRNTYIHIEKLRWKDSGYVWKVRQYDVYKTLYSSRIIRVRTLHEAYEKSILKAIEIYKKANCISNMTDKKLN